MTESRPYVDVLFWGAILIFGSKNRLWKILKNKIKSITKNDPRLKSLLNALNETPRLLKELISEINPELYKQELVKRKWSIHEHATHIARKGSFRHYKVQIFFSVIMP